ncbi:MAG: hypothetical protein RIK87_28335 [Fuerstiella sp.]
MSIVNPQLRDQYAQLHSAEQYGAGSARFALHIQACISDLKPRHILDYGCGQSLLGRELDLGTATYHRYDPAIAEIAEVPVRAADLVINTDVMEHIPKPDLSEVLAHQRSLSAHVFFNIATRKASQYLPSGENAHCTIMTAQQWLRTIWTHFPDAELVADHPGHSCLIITWKSPVLAVLAGIERLRIVERQRDEYRQSPVRRLRRTARGVLNWMTNQTPDPAVLFPDTRRVREA